MRVLLGAGESAIDRLDGAARARRTIDPRPIRSAFCQQRPLRASSRPSAPKPRPSSTIPPFPARRKISFGRRWNGYSTNSPRSAALRRPGCRWSAKRRSRKCRPGRTMPSSSTTRLSASSRSRRRARAATRANSPTRTTRGNGASSSPCRTSSIPTATASAFGATANPPGKIVLLEGDIETSGAKLKAPEALRALVADFLTWAPQPPTSARALAQTSARLCRLLRDEVLEEMAAGHGSLQGLKQDWRKLLFPEATDAQFADGYAQAVTFGLLMAQRVRHFAEGRRRTGGDPTAKNEHADRHGAQPPDPGRSQSAIAENLARHADPRPRRSELGDAQQGQAGSLALFL